MLDLKRLTEFYFRNTTLTAHINSSLTKTHLNYTKATKKRSKNSALAGKCNATGKPRLWAHIFWNRSRKAIHVCPKQHIYPNWWWHHPNISAEVCSNSFAMKNTFHSSLFHKIVNTLSLRVSCFSYTLELNRSFKKKSI